MCASRIIYGNNYIMLNFILMRNSNSTMHYKIQYTVGIQCRWVTAKVQLWEVSNQQTAYHDGINGAISMELEALKAEICLHIAYREKWA